jgi:hypothetical protein
VLDAWQHALPDLDDAVAPSLVITAPAEPARPPMVTVFGAAADPWWGSPRRSRASCRATNAQVTPETRTGRACLDPRRVPHYMGTRRHQPERPIGGGRCAAATAQRPRAL